MTNFIVGKPSKVKYFFSLHTSCGIALMLNHVTLLRDQYVDFLPFGVNDIYVWDIKIQSKIIDEELSFSFPLKK